MTFNACNKFRSSKNSANFQAASCKTVMENGRPMALHFKPLEDSLFAQSKVRLRQDASRDQLNLQAKAEGAMVVPRGSRLAVIMDNACVRDGSQVQSLARALADTNGVNANLAQQAYLWELDHDTTDIEIEQQVNAEFCIVGLSWNRDYQLQTFSTNDPGVSNQKHFAAINAASAYDYFYNSSGGMTTTGQSVLIAVIDSGVDWQHPDIKSNMWAHTNGIGIDISTLGTSLVDYNPFDVSSSGHGTHVAGLIAAVANNGLGVMGAMPYRAQIMGIKVFNRNASGELSATTQYFYNAMQFAYLNGANVINLSLSSIVQGPVSDALVQAAITNAVNSGVVVSVVIGNADSTIPAQEVNGTTLSVLPGIYATTAGVIGVGSIDATTGNKSYFSHFSKTYAEIGAPGAESSSLGLYSTIPTALGSYGRLMGTSQAAPLVTAAAGMTIGMIREAYNVKPSPAEVERLILASAMKSSSLTNYFKDGNRLDFQKLVDQIQQDYPLTKMVAETPTDPTSPPPPTSACPP